VVVVDASAAVCLLVDWPPNRAARLWLRLEDEQLRAPHLIDIEIASTLRRLTLHGELDPVRAESALADFARMSLVRYPHYPYLPAVWRHRFNRTAYDAAYVALAEALGVPLLTLDSRLARTPGAVPIEVY
jgi:predicted nucleic acid-binding protein